MLRHRPVVPILAFLAVATIAAAFTVSELQKRADSLLPTYQALVAQANACADGQCPERASIESSFASAESQRTQLHTDRATLNPCGSCQHLDSTLQAVDGAADEVAGIIEGWAGQGIDPSHVTTVPQRE